MSDYRKDGYGYITLKSESLLRKILQGWVDGKFVIRGDFCGAYRMLEELATRQGITKSPPPKPKISREAYEAIKKWYEGDHYTGIKDYVEVEDD